MDNKTEQTELLAPELMLIDEDDGHSPVIKLERFPDPAILGLGVASPSKHPIKRLLVIHGEGALIRYPLNKPEITIGRSTDADIEIHGRYVSRIHALIRLLEDSSTVIEDVGSKNGLLINGEYCDYHTLQHGDSVLIAQVLLEYQEVATRA